MANLILTSDGWQDRIRYKLGVHSAYLSDAEIESPEVINVAEGNIVNQLPLYASYEDEPTGDPPTFKRTWLEAATVCECASLLCPSMETRLPRSERGPHFSQDSTTDWNQRQTLIENERDGYIDKILGTSTYRMHFGLTQTD
jgi:hypothetical protein